MPSRNLNDLTPSMKEKALQLQALCRGNGIEIMITCTARTYQEQVALYAQGRQSLAEVNALRKVAGLPPITEAENCRRVTWTLHSKHIINLRDGDTANDKARAFDIAVLKNGKPCWDIKADIDQDDIPDYEEAARLGESLGLRAGARFSKPDYPHFEDAAA